MRTIEQESIEQLEDSFLRLSGRNGRTQLGIPASLIRMVAKNLSSSREILNQNLKF